MITHRQTDRQTDKKSAGVELRFAAKNIYYVIIILRTIQRIRNQENSTIFILYRKISQKTPKTSIKMKKSKFISVLDVEKELCIWYMMLIQNLNKNNIFNIRNKN